MNVGHRLDLPAVDELTDISRPVEWAVHDLHRPPLVARRRRAHFIDLFETGQTGRVTRRA